MNLYGGHKNREEPEEVNMTSVMNIFLILIPFLLLTAVFTRIAVLEISLPTGGGAGNVSDTPPEKRVLFIVVVTEKGDMQIQTMSGEKIKFDRIYSTGNQQYNFKTLVSQLKQLKEKYPWLQELVLRPEENVKYDTIIKIMDRCREEGFPNISLA